VSEPPTRHELLHGAFESFPDAVVVADDRKRIVLANAGCRELLGHDPRHLVGQPVSLLVPSLPAGVGQQARRVELSAVRADGTRLPAEVTLAPLAHDGGAYWVVTVRDLQQQADDLRSDLIATVSHELRTPLTSIVGYAELLRDLPDDDVSPAARRLVGVVERNAARELRLVDDLLTLAFLGKEQMPVALRPLDLGEVVRGSVEAGRTPARRRGLVLAVHDAGVPLVHGDAQRLGQVVDNLLANAVKFTPPGGRVDLRVRDDGDAALLEVADTGPGVPEADLERIFDRLYRTAAAVRAQVPGAGLGLAIVRAIMDAHGGQVEARSTPGRGTVVRVRVPYRSSARTSTTAEVSSGP
jgi:protein-histidine pros-kinase